MEGHQTLIRLFQKVSELFQIMEETLLLLIIHKVLLLVNTILLTSQIHLTVKEAQLFGTMETVKEKTLLMHTGMLDITKMEGHQTSIKLFPNLSVLSQIMEKTLLQLITH